MPRHYGKHSRSHKRRGKKNIVSKTFNKGVSMVKNTSSKYMPKVKTSLENVGSKVVKTGKQTVPYLQSLTRKLFTSVGLGKKSRSNKR